MADVVTIQSVDFSIVVPTYNRPQQLAECLSALAKLDYGRARFEVIVVDDGSATPLEPVTAPFQDRMQLSLIRQENAGPAAARNRGAQVATGTWLAFTDDDCQPSPDWLRVLARELSQQHDPVVGGRTVNGLSDNLCSSMSQIIVDVVYRHYNACPEDAHFFATNNLAIGRDLFHRVGGFNPAFTTSEDRDLCDRLSNAGIRMRYAADGVVEHRHTLSLRGFCRQHFQYGCGAFRFHCSQRQRHSRHTWTKTSFHLDLGNWLLYPFSQVSPGRWPGLFSLLFLWQFTNTVGFAVEGLRQLTLRRRPEQPA